MRRRRFAHVGVWCLVCTGAVLGLAHPAAADDGPASSVSQYVEMIPTSSGERPSGTGGASTSGLSARAKAALGGADPTVAKQLTVIATSPSYGAPATAPTKKPVGTASDPSSPGRPADSRPTTTEANSVSTLGVLSADTPSVIGLAMILGITTVAMIFAAAAGKRRDRGADR